jgi:hypothetical protein
VGGHLHKNLPIESFLIETNAAPVQGIVIFMLEVHLALQHILTSIYL